MEVFKAMFGIGFIDHNELRSHVAKGEGNPPAKPNEEESDIAVKEYQSCYIKGKAFDEVAHCEAPGFVILCKCTVELCNTLNDLKLK